MIVVVPKGCLRPTQIEDLNNKGYSVIECDEPEKVKIILPEPVVNTNDYFMSALKAISEDNMSGPKEKFVRELFGRLSKKERGSPSNGDTSSNPT